MRGALGSEYYLFHYSLSALSDNFVVYLNI